MRLLTDLASRLRSLWSLIFGRSEDRDLANEIRFHIEKQTEKNLAAGMSPEEARRRAHIQFGGVERTREKTREARGVLGLERLLTDLRLAHRGLLRTPGQTLAAVVTLGLGIGVATTMFGTIYGAFYRALPWDDPDRFVWVERTSAVGEGGWAVPLHDFAEWREASRSFEDLGAVHTRSVGLRTSTGTTQLPAAHVTWNAFEIIGTQPFMGRGFTRADDRPGAPLVVVISQRTWEEQYGADPELIGQGVAVNGEPATIVGVMPEGFHFPEFQDAWMPLREDPNQLARGEGPGLMVFGHLAEGVTHEEADAEVRMLAERTAAEHPETNEGIGATVLDFVEWSGTGDAILINWMLMIAALAVLLIACVNVANLLLTRAARRVRELALRSALGAGRGQIVLHVLAESCTLAVYGAVLGTGLGWLGVAGIRQGISSYATLPYWIRFEVDLTVLLFTVALAAAAGIIAGLIPAVRASRGDLAGVLKDGSRGSTGLSVGRVSRALVGVEVAFAVCLLVVSGLMIKSVVTLATYELPFEDESVLVSSVELFDDTPTDPAVRDTLVAELLDRSGELAGVEAAALTSGVPGLPTERGPWEIEGRTYRTDQEVPLAHTMTVSADYFELLGVELVTGRGFTEVDASGGPAVAIVNRSFVERHFSGEDPLGRRIRTDPGQVGPGGEWRVVVGVVPDLLMQGLEQIGPSIGDGVYVPATQAAGLPSILLLRSRGEPLGLVDELRTLARSIRPDLAVYDTRTLPYAMAQLTWYFTLTSQVFVAFGAVALILAGVGLLGVVAAESERRTQEVGIRMALGARAVEVVRLIVGQGVRHVLAGVAVGVLMAIGLARALTIVLFETDPWDPAIYTAAVAFIILVSALASLVPAVRAARTDPVRSLQAG